MKGNIIPIRTWSSSQKTTTPVTLTANTVPIIWTTMAIIIAMQGMGTATRGRIRTIANITWLGTITIIIHSIYFQWQTTYNAYYFTVPNLISVGLNEKCTFRSLKNEDIIYQQHLTKWFFMSKIKISIFPIFFYSSKRVVTPYPFMEGSLFIRDLRVAEEVLKMY